MVSIRVRTSVTLEYKWQAAIIVALGLFLSVLDNTIVSVALPAMRRTFSTDFDTITWVVTAYFLAQAAVIPVTGALNDRYGTKAVFLLALAVFVIGSALCVVSPSRDFLISARVVQGLGGGALFPTSFAIAYRAFPREEWGRATTVIGVPVLLAPALGPVLGGWLTSTFDWRVIFAVNLPIGMAALAAASALLHSQAEDELEDDSGQETESRNVPRFDVPGFVLSAAGFAMLVYGLTEAGLYGWANAVVIRSLLLSAVLQSALIVVELRARAPVLDVRLFRNPTFSVAGCLLWLTTGLYYGSLFLIPFFFERVQGDSAMTAGEILISQGIASAIGIAIAGELYNKVGPRPLALVGAGALAISMIGFTRLSLGSSGASLQGWLVLRGLGIGLTTIPMQNLALASVGRREVARASSLINVLRQATGAACLAIMAAYLSQQSIAHFHGLVAHGRLSSGSSAVDLLQRTAIVRGLNDTFSLLLVACALALVLAVFVRQDPTRVRPDDTAATWLASVFPDVGAPEIARLVARVQPVTFQPGQTIVRQGEIAEQFYIITDGQVRVSVDSDGIGDGKVRLMEHGDFFGEIGLLTGRPRSATVTATRTTRLLTLDRETFSHIVGGSQRTADRLREVMWQRLAVMP